MLNENVFEIYSTPVAVPFAFHAFNLMYVKLKFKYSHLNAFGIGKRKENQNFYHKIIFFYEELLYSFSFNARIKHLENPRALLYYDSIAVKCK